MDLPLEQEELLRWYLLGATSAEEDEQIEEALQDADMKYELLLVEEDLIDDYARGLMSIGDRELFELNFLTTPERRQKLSIARAAVRYAAEQNAATNAVGVKQIKEVTADLVGKPQAPTVDVVSWTRSWWQALFYPSWKIPIYAVVVIGVGVAAWQSLQSRSDIPTALAAMNRAYSQKRPLEVRISNLSHAPYPKTRGMEQERNDSVELDLAERILLDEVVQHPSATAKHVLGQLYMAQKKFDQAQDLFNQALQAEPNNARIHSDLGALLYEKWENQRSVVTSAAREELKRQSLEHLTKALDLDDKLLDARFNRALLYQNSGQTQSARDEWQKYLALDPSSPWADEAKVYLSIL